MAYSVEQERALAIARARKARREREEREAEKSQQQNAQAVYDNKSTIDKVRGGLGAIQEGQLLGFGDEIVGAGRAALEELVGGGDYDFGEGMSDETQSWGDKYRMYRDDERANNKDFANANTKKALGLSLAGGLAAPIPGAGTAAQGAKLLTRAAQQGARMAGEGAVAGLGMSEAEDMSGLRDDALKGGAFSLATGTGLKGLGGIGSAMSKRRVADDLVDSTGRRKPLNLVDEPIGDAYRSIARVPGARGKIQDLEQPFIDDARNAVARADESLYRAKQTAASEAEHAKNILKEQGRNIEDTIDVAARNAMDAAESLPKSKAEKVAGSFRSNAAKESLPTDARNILDNVDTKNDVAKVRTKLEDYWKNSAFKEVKDNWFDFDGTLGNKITERVKEDPALRLAIGDIMPKLKKMQAQLSDELPGKELPEDYVKAMLSGKYQIDGEALMAMRNVFASGANGQSKNSWPLRQIANEFDDFIRKGLDDIDPKLTDRFNENIQRYTTALSYMAASGSKAARKNGYKFTPDQWMGASGKYAGKGMSAKAAPLEARAKVYNDKIGSVAEEGRLAKAAARQSKADAKKAARRNMADRRAAATKKANTDQEALRREAKTGALPMAKENAKALNEKLIARNVSPLSDLFMAEQLGAAVPALSRAGGKRAGAGLGIGAAIGSNTMQDLLAGQTGVQETYRKLIASGYPDQLARALARQAALQATGE